MACLVALHALGFDASKFRTRCDQSSFCRTLHPSYIPPSAPFELIEGSLTKREDGVVTARVWQPLLGLNSSATLLFRAAADAHGDSAPVWKLQMLLTTAAARSSNGFAVSRLVLPRLPAAPVNMREVRAGVHVLRAEGSVWWSELELRASPLRVRLHVGQPGDSATGPAQIVFNGNGLLRFAASDALDEPSSGRSGFGAAAACQAVGRAPTRDGNVDSVPHGCTAVSADVSFPGALEAFGLPERAAPLALRPTVQKVRRQVVDAATTGSTEAPAVAEDAAVLAPMQEGDGRGERQPYRLFNLDVFKYEPYTPVSLYGALPFVMAHGPRRAAAAVWLNAADTYVDLWHGEADGELADEDSVEGGGVGTAWLSEGGAIELLLLGGPSARVVLRQLALSTGRPPMPPLWSLGYHQSHWNIKSQAQAAALERNFDRHGVPLDGLWLDIEHTSGKRYFTWDRDRFPSPDDLDEQLRPKGRRLVAIADPHLKADPRYEVHATAETRGWLVRSARNTTFVGKCWPGDSTYLDFFQPAARDYWTSLYTGGPLPSASVDGQARDVSGGVGLGWPTWLHAWNDMNEPSVFDSEELTLPRDAIHHVGSLPSDLSIDEEEEALDVEHRVVHNAYGALQIASTHAGLVARSRGTERPFLLSRSFFVGSQRHGAVWTGDNTASWSHLRLSFAMLLSLSVSGFSFVGADVGGFFGQPSPQLLARWYQAAAYLPFFRGHAHVDEARREPYLLPQPYASVAIEAIRERQRLMPYWTTIWYHAAHADGAIGAPVISPPWLHFPPTPSDGAEDARVLLRTEGQWMVGEAILVQPVAMPDVATVTVRLPSTRATRWYDVSGVLPAARGGEELTVATPLAATPTFQLGGTIVPRRERVRRSALLAINDPLTLHIAPNSTHGARGQLFLDDGVSTPLAAREAVLVDFSFRCEVGDTCELRAAPMRLWGAASERDVHVEAVLIRGMRLPGKMARAVLTVHGESSVEVEVQVHETPSGLLIPKLKAPARKAGWTLRLAAVPGSE